VGSVSPCGRAVDMLRSAYRTRCKLYRDAPDIAPMYWYRCDPGALDLGTPTVYTSLNWSDPKEPGLAGEVKGAPRPWSVGLNWNGLTGQGEPCGRLEAIHLGAQVGVDPPLLRRPDGSPLCCSQPPIWTGGGGGGGSWPVLVTRVWSGGGAGGGTTPWVATSLWSSGGGGGGSWSPAAERAWSGGGGGGGTTPWVATSLWSSGGGGGGSWFTPGIDTACCPGRQISLTLLIETSILFGSCPCFRGQSGLLTWSAEEGAWIGSILPIAGKCPHSDSFTFRLQCFSQGWLLTRSGCGGEMSLTLEFSACDPFRQFWGTFTEGTCCGTPYDVSLYYTITEV